MSSRTDLYDDDVVDDDATSFSALDVVEIDLIAVVFVVVGALDAVEITDETTTAQYRVVTF